MQKNLKRMGLPIKCLQLLSIIASLAFDAYSQKIVFKTKCEAINEKFIKDELAVYPKPLIRQYLDSIYVVSSDIFCGRAGATRKMELTCNCDPAFQRYTIHHELSTIFMKGYYLEVDRNYFNIMYGKFMQWNGKYSYDPKSGMENISSDSELADYFYGLTYAQTGFENDFNVIASYLFKDGKKLIKHIDARPSTPIYQKVHAVIDFYNKLDSRFTVDFFKKIQ